MDKAQASAVVDAMLQGARQHRLPSITQGPGRFWSHAEWRLVLLVGILWLCSVVAVAFACGLALDNVLFVAEITGPVGFLLGFVIVGWRRVVRQRSDSARASSAAARRS